MKKQEMAYDIHGSPHPVTDHRNDNMGAKFGLWVFLFTEIIMFGILFLLFAIYFYRHADIFAASSGNLNVWLGGTNTVILLVSTYTMGLATMKMQQENIRTSAVLVGITAILSVIFLVIKAVEWYVDIQHGLYPGSEILAAMEKGDILFFGLYFVMTGIHGLHVIIGIALMCWTLVRINGGGIVPTHIVAMKNVTLYWDFVHLIWIVLFPLFYMIGA